MKNRKEKIRFLKGLINRQRNIDELMPENNLFIVSSPDKNGIIKHRCNGKELTEEEYKMLLKKGARRIEVKYVDTPINRV